MCYRGFHGRHEITSSQFYSLEALDLVVFVETTWHSHFRCPCDNENILVNKLNHERYLNVLLKYQRRVEISNLDKIPSVGCQWTHSFVVACSFKCFSTDIGMNRRNIFSIHILFFWSNSIIKFPLCSCSYWAPWTKYFWSKILSENYNIINLSQ